MRYEAMCSMCRGRTCDKEDEYAGYVGALRCLTLNNGDVAFSKLTVAQQFFAVSGNPCFGIISMVDTRAVLLF